jgi:hypothetical protein
MLKHLAEVAAHKFGLTVWQWLPGPVGHHAAASLHYQRYPDGIGRAFDAYGKRWRMGRYVRWLKRTGHWKRLSEGIYNGYVQKLSVKNHKRVPSSFWGAETWKAHRGHIHLGI